MCVSAAISSLVYHWRLWAHIKSEAVCRYNHTRCTVGWKCSLSNQRPCQRTLINSACVYAFIGIEDILVKLRQYLWLVRYAWLLEQPVV